MDLSEHIFVYRLLFGIYQPKGHDDSKFLKEKENCPGSPQSSPVFGERGREGGSLFVRISPAEKSFRLVEIINYDRARVSGHHNLYLRRQVTLQFNYLHVLNLQLYVINTNLVHFWAGSARKSYYRFCTWLDVGSHCLVMLARVQTD